MAEATAKAILLSYPMVSQVDLTIKKPWAPIGLPLDTVSVEISRSWHTAYIALGSNMGDKEKYLNEAVEKLQQTSDCQVLKVSDFLVTAPYGGVEQDDFLNGALTLKTLLTPQELIIPHVEMHLRDFVLIPLAQIAPWKRHPVLGLTVSQMQADLQAKQKS